MLAWREAACTLAFIVGPTVGGMLFTGRGTHSSTSQLNLSRF